MLAAISDSLVELRKRYAVLETEELFAIAHTDSDQYRSAAVRVAREELARRKVSNEDAAEFQQKAETKRIGRLDEEEKPLPAGLKLLCLVFAGMPALVTYAIMESKGRKRAAREAIVWFSAGFGLWLVLRLLIPWL